jgi:hypothetical protein
VLLGVGVVALVLVVPTVWILLVYGRALVGVELWGAGICLSVMAAGIGLAMIRILDGGG